MMSPDRQNLFRFHPRNRDEVFMWQNFQPPYRDSWNRASPLSHGNISYQIFYNGFRGKARPRKPDLCEEALNLSIYRTKITYTYLTRLLHGLRYSS